MTAGIDLSSLKHLEAEAHRYDFFQLVRLIEAGRADDVEVEILPTPILVFPPGDVRALSLGEDGRVGMTVTFMGLYGVDSPLPLCFSTPLSTDTDEHTALQDFLDFFNRRLYRYFFRSWVKYRPAIQYERAREHVSAVVFSSLAGLDAVEAAGHDLTARLLPFAGVLGTSVRNREGLFALLSTFLPAVSVEIRENVPRWVPVAERPRLGAGGGRLGESMIAGARLFDRSGKFRVVLGPLSLRQYRDLLPGGPLADIVERLIALYAPDGLEYDVELKLDTREVPPLKLGERSLKMGTNTWLGRPAGDAVSEVVAYA
jgi:type VI secretion system protein ImpH